MSQSIVYEVMCRKLVCRTKRKLDEKYYRYNFYLFVRERLSQDGLRRVTSNMSDLFENKTLNQALLRKDSFSPVKNNDEEEDDQEPDYSEDDELHSSLSIRSEEISEQSISNSEYKREKSIGMRPIERESGNQSKPEKEFTLNLKKIKVPSTDWKENDPQMMRLDMVSDEFSVKDVKLKEYSREPSRANTNTLQLPLSPQRGPTEKVLYKETRKIYWNEKCRPVILKVAYKTNFSKRCISMLPLAKVSSSVSGFRDKIRTMKCIWRQLISKSA